jgi:hypothetical protein
MRFPSMMSRIRNMQAGTESTPSSPYCPQPGQEPPWLTKAREYLVPSYLNADSGKYPTREYFDKKRTNPDTNSWDRIKGWAATVKGVNVDELDFDAADDGWCAAFLGAMLAKCGLEHSGSNRANDYYNPETNEVLWGKRLEEEHVGAIVVFDGHVGFVVETFEMARRKNPRAETGYVLGGNQTHSVNILQYKDIGKVKAYLWPSECPCPGEASESGEANGQSSQ